MNELAIRQLQELTNNVILLNNLVFALCFLVILGIIFHFIHAVETWYHRIDMKYLRIEFEEVLKKVEKFLKTPIF